MPIIIFSLLLSISLYTIRNMKNSNTKENEYKETLNEYLEYVEKEIIELEQKNV